MLDWFLILCLGLGFFDYLNQFSISFVLGEVFYLDLNQSFNDSFYQSIYIGRNFAINSILQKILNFEIKPNASSNIFFIFHYNTIQTIKGMEDILVKPNQEQKQAANESFLPQPQPKKPFFGPQSQVILRKLQGSCLTELTQLKLYKCKLKDFDQMFRQTEFPHLVDLDLSQNEFTSFRMLGSLPDLKCLIINHNKIQTLFVGSDLATPHGLNNCQNLQILDVSRNNLKDFEGLQHCKLSQLKILKASFNQILRIDHLQQLIQLKQLDVNNNKIKQLDPISFQGNPTLKCLKIQSNSLKNFSNIQNLQQLQHLFACRNKVSEFQDIQILAELQNLKELELMGNDLCRKYGYRVTLVKKLQKLIYLDQREITQEEKDYCRVLLKMSSANYQKKPKGKVFGIGWLSRPKVDHDQKQRQHPQRN